MDLPGLLALSSPRSWGCFPYPAPHRRRRRVFPTLVGVFPITRAISRLSYRLPHARGGVSHLTRKALSGRKSSPRSWGCFSSCDCHLATRTVFPTLVGGFPGMASRPGRMFRLPHARGGVSLMSYLRQSSGWSSPRSWGCFQDSLLHGGLSVRSGSYSMSCVLIQKR